jgi:hypothetical protein
VPRHRISVRAKESPSFDVRRYFFCFVKKGVFLLFYTTSSEAKLLTMKATRTS